MGPDTMQYACPTPTHLPPLTIALNHGSSFRETARLLSGNSRRRLLDGNGSAAHHVTMAMNAGSIEGRVPG